MYFQFPNEEDPFYKRFFMTILFFVELFVEISFPAMVAVVLLAVAVFMCGSMLGSTQGFRRAMTDHHQPREGQAGSSDPAQALDEKRRLKLEMEILEEMLRTRRERVERLVKSD